MTAKFDVNASINKSFNLYLLKVDGEFLASFSAGISTIESDFSVIGRWKNEY
jgi:hypothetical protein